MSYKRLASTALHCLSLVFQFTIGGPLVSLILAGQNDEREEPRTGTRIQHTIERGSTSGAVRQIQCPKRVWEKAATSLGLKIAFTLLISRFIPPFT
jgi:hypothetical protein